MCDAALVLAFAAPSRPRASDCSVTGTAKNKYPGWSGNHAEMESDVNLSAAPFNAVAGRTISIAFRMLSDNSQNGTGWDINWVKLVGD